MQNNFVVIEKKCILVNTNKISINSYLNEKLYWANQIFADSKIRFFLGAAPNKIWQTRIYVNLKKINAYRNLLISYQLTFLTKFCVTKTNTDKYFPKNCSGHSKKRNSQTGNQILKKKLSFLLYVLKRVKLFIDAIESMSLKKKRFIGCDFFLSLNYLLLSSP